ncbi:MAG: hypothetical protein Kow0079_00570 [Vicingaceae bacterium]
MNKANYILLAELFRYPKEGYKEKVNEVMSYLQAHYPEAANELTRFHDFINQKTLAEIEEIYGITFHIQAICYLDVGYILFGEDYKRGEFLVNMKREQAKINNDCGEELPDNIANMLTLLSKSNEEEFVKELSVRVLIPAVKKMLEEFRAARLELKTKVIKKKQKAIILEDKKEGNVFQHPISALLKVLEKDFENVHYPQYDVQPTLGNFMTGCGTCSETTSNNKTIKTQ